MCFPAQCQSWGKKRHWHYLERQHCPSLLPFTSPQNLARGVIVCASVALGSVTFGNNLISTQIVQRGKNWHRWSSVSVSCCFIIILFETLPPQRYVPSGRPSTTKSHFSEASAVPSCYCELQHVDIYMGQCCMHPATLTHLHPGGNSDALAYPRKSGLGYTLSWHHTYGK